MKKTIAQFLLATALVGGTTFATADVALAAGRVPAGGGVFGSEYAESARRAVENVEWGAKSACQSGEIRSEGKRISVIQVSDGQRPLYRADIQAFCA